MSNVKFLKIEDMSKGIDVFSRDTMLKNDETAEASNVVTTGKASIMKREGTSLLLEVPGGTPIDGIGTYYSNSTRKLLVMSGGTLYEGQSGTAVAVSAYPASAGVLTPGYMTDFCQAGANIFISNGIDKMRVFDGTTIRTQTGGIIAKYMIYYKNYLFAIGNSSYASALYRSGLDTKIGDFTYDATANPFATSINISNLDGQELSSFFKHQDYLYCSKDRSTYRISIAGDTVATMSYELVDPARGSDSHHATDAVENDVFIFNEHGVHSIGYQPNMLDQIRTTIMSKKIDPKIKSIKKSMLEKVCGMYYDNYFRMAYQSEGAAVNDKIGLYDRLRSGWWEYALKASCFCEFKDASGQTKLYFGSPLDGKVKYFDPTVKSDCGEKIRTLWKSPKYGVGDIPQSKFFLHAVLYMGVRPGNFTIYVYIDGKLIKTKNVLLGATGSSGLGIDSIGVSKIGVGGGGLTIPDTGGSDMIKIPVNKMGRNIQIYIEDYTSDKGWELNNIEIAFVPLNKIYQPNVL